MGAGIINPFPGQACEWVDYSQGSGDSNNPDHSDIRGFTQDPNLATAVTSVVRESMMTDPFGENRMHKPVIDLDLDAKLVPSTTPGHHHLFIDKAMTWDNYVRLLCVLAEVGIVEPGYVSACIDQGRSSVRLPHVRKPGAGVTFSEDGRTAWQDSGANLEVAPGVIAPHATTVDLSHMFPR